MASRFKLRRALPCYWCGLMTMWETVTGLPICDDDWEAGRG